MPLDDAIAPSLPALLALRRAVLQGPRPARRGAYGSTGMARAVQRGRGMEYAESREYTPGDDVRHIDWRLSARTGRAHTKLFQAERERLHLVVADTAPALYFGTRGRFKSVQAARAAALAAWLALAEGDRIAALRGSVHEPPLRPLAGQQGVVQVLTALCRWYRQPPEDDAGLGQALTAASRVLRPGARLTVVAEPASVVAIERERWLAVAQRSEATVLLLSDPFEQAPPARALPFVLATGRQVLALDSKAQRQAWQAAFAAPLAAASAMLASCAIRAIELPCDADSAAWLCPRVPGVER